ncbi:amidohydrolase family protein [Amycolatopsis endophytica]|uniref:Cytosine/adenosine deaminase-related metal-dependent hydrolase n=1 Tax=Amycolatopsis endophytica TaxID=860233 RepID=A0A853BC78_9PSEU|nr:amidohydrolase family protein [Amycolatopsis endophytica]NYI92988.1 cytosine/adenosine deaminase-related metal-dependent hydrolase [Amycolatopsis endophytica]
MTQRRLIKNGTIVSMDPTLGDLARGDVLVEDDRIEALAPDLGPVDAEIIDASGCIVMPGLIDTHRHTWQAFLRGIAADWTLGQYMTGLHLGLSAFFTAEDTYAGNFAGAVEALDSGITTLLDWSHNVNTPEQSDAAVHALADSGIRAVFAHGGGADMYQVPSDVPHDRDVRRVRGEHFSAGDGLLTMAMALRGPQFATVDVTESDVALARELDLPITLHAGDGEWGRSGPIRRLAERGLLGPDTTYVHCNTLGDDELRLIADSGGTVSIAPDIEMQMGHGWPATGRLLAAGIRPGLSIDTCVSNGGHLWGTMRVALATQRALDNSEPGASDRPEVSLGSRDVLSFATLDGARVLGLGHKVGSLTPGKQADILLVRADTVALAPLNNPVGQLVYAAHPGLVDTILVAGEVVKHHGVLIGDRAKRACRLATEHRDALFDRAARSERLTDARTGGGWQPAPLTAAN